MVVNSVVVHDKPSLLFLSNRLPTERCKTLTKTRPGRLWWSRWLSNKRRREEGGGRRGGEVGGGGGRGGGGEGGGVGESVPEQQTQAANRDVVCCMQLQNTNDKSELSHH